MLFSIRSFVSKMSPLDMYPSSDECVCVFESVHECVFSLSKHFRKDGFLAFQTSRYKLHYYETPTGIKLVMNTDLGVPNCRDTLQQIYSTVRPSLYSSTALCFTVVTVLLSDRSCTWSTSWRTRCVCWERLFRAICSTPNWTLSSERCRSSASARPEPDNTPSSIYIERLLPRFLLLNIIVKRFFLTNWSK